jgi:hypothetical protein
MICSAPWALPAGWCCKVSGLPAAAVVLAAIRSRRVAAALFARVRATSSQRACLGAAGLLAMSAVAASDSAAAAWSGEGPVLIVSTPGGRCATADDDGWRVLVQAVPEPTQPPCRHRQKGRARRPQRGGGVGGGCRRQRPAGAAAAASRQTPLAGAARCGASSVGGCLRAAHPMPHTRAHHWHWLCCAGKLSSSLQQQLDSSLMQVRGVQLKLEHQQLALRLPSNPLRICCSIDWNPLACPPPPHHRSLWPT